MPEYSNLQQTLATADKAPARSRSRNRGAAAAAAVAPSTPAKPAPSRDRSPRRSSKPKESDVKKYLAGGIIALDGMAGMFAAQYWTEEDHLSRDETKMAVDAIYDELAQYPSTLTWIMQAGGISKHLNLVLALGIIAAPRLARHGVLPIGFAELATLAGAMGTGGTHGDTGGNQEREINAGLPGVNSPEIPGGVPLQNGPGADTAELSRGQDGAESPSDGPAWFEPAGAPSEV